MPRKKEPSFETKKIIWDVAATRGLDNLSAIEREVDFQLKKLHQGKNFFDETPDQRKIKDIILNDIQKLTPETVIDKLPRHVWPLRKDYSSLLDLSNGNGKIIPKVAIPEISEKKVNVGEPAPQVVPESKPKLSDVEFANEVLKIAKNKQGYIYYSDFYHLNPNPKTTFYLFTIKTILKSNGYVCHPLNEIGTWGCKYQGTKAHFHHPGLGMAEEKINNVDLPDVSEKQLTGGQPPIPIVPRVTANASDSDDEFMNKMLQLARNKKGVIFYSDFNDLNPKPGDGHFLFKVKNILLSHDYICHESRKRPWDCKYYGRHTHFHHPKTTNNPGYIEDTIDQ